MSKPCIIFKFSINEKTIIVVKIKQKFYAKHVHFRFNERKVISQRGA